ncbi:hypothetical protein MIMGU_mgv1a022151mg [Erythranthe guttata]|uniref:Uncharacterized protein n=1 Tax=Erythranthe guttata TaxID=4155 RepID=A0A022QD32_ERYGU|nr:PREDICTED: uncharacterized protein LOC105971426 [Erythranthe guttata]XP_012851736.1 PREDICTED: uncharacterized protein LOC105971426 [Erythranthe guttata]EYU25519.1 hypothetical protein MIMGU_mgv1a022151mg [Erythranthe guttata]|eukprot:XP_012851735.1 PREDICTED: uncharacterized protein LOC105971426 [Erythranthe guttata]
MDAYPPLPADYVSFAQLQERWIQKQEQEKLKSKQEDEKQKREAEEIQSEIRNRSGSKNNGHGKPWGASPGNAPPRVVGKDGRVMGGAIQAKGKGKEAAIGGSENGDGSNLRKKKNKRKNGRYEKKNKSDEIEKEKSKSDEVEGVKEIIANVSILPKDAVMSEVKGIERLDTGGGVTRNGRSHNRVRSGYKSNVSILPNDAVRSEVNGVEETANVSILPKDAVRSEIRGSERLDIGGGVRRNGHSNNRVRSGYKSNVSILPKDSVRSEVKGVEEIANVSILPKDEVMSEIQDLEGLDIGRGVRRNGHSNNWDRSGNKSRTEYRVRVNGTEMKSVFEEKESKPNVEGESISDVRENGEKGIKYHRNRKSKENINREIGRYGDRWKPKPREGGVMMWVKKEDKPAA